MNRLAVILVGASLLWCAIAWADEFEGLDAIHLFDEFSVNIVDDVKGGCWTNVDAVRTEVELILRRNGLRVVEEGDLVDVSVTCYGFGGRTSKNSYCLGSFSCRVVTWGTRSTRDGEATGLLSLHEFGPRIFTSDNFNGQFMEDASAFAKKVANAYLKQKQKHGE